MSTLVKADPVRKKRKYTEVIGGNLVEQELGNYSFAKKWTDWKTKLMGIDASKMGLSSKKGTTMFTLLTLHGKPKRKKSPNQNDGIGKIIGEIDKLILSLVEGNRIMTSEDLEKVTDFIDDIEDMKDSSLDPRYIPFTTPIEVVGKVGKFPEGENPPPNTFGHYNTPLYRKLQENKGNTPPKEIPDSWYSESAGANTNPMYQVIFMENNDMGVTGLIHILKELEKAGEGATIKNIVIKTRYKYDNLLSIGDFRTQLAKKLRNDPSVYLRGKHQNVINQAALLREVKKMKFDVKSNEERYLRTVPELEDALGDIEHFQIDITKAGLMNKILPTFFRHVKRMKAPNNEPILFRKPKPQPVEEQPPQEQVDEGEKGENQKDVKKSWRQRLWAR